MATIETFQLTSNAIGPLTNSTANSYGVMYATYDVASVHMAVQGTLDHFTVPTGSDLVALTLLARCDATAANVGINCYSMSINLSATASSIQFGKFVNGAFTSLATFNNVVTPSTQLFEFDCAGTAPTILTCKVNGNTVTDNVGAQVTTTDASSPITTGSHAGIHWFSTTATPDAYFTSFAAFSIPAPQQGGGGGGFNQGGARSVLARPFQGGDNSLVRCAPMNMPIGANAAYDSRATVPNTLQPSAANGFGTMVGGAGYPMVANNNGEGHYSIYQSNGNSADEYYGGVWNGSIVSSFTFHMVTDVKGTGVNVGYDVATKLSQLGGCIRAADIPNNYLHALQFAHASTVLAKTLVWPAFDKDSFAGTNTGFMPYGSLSGIDPAHSTIPNFAGMGYSGQDLQTLTWIWNCCRYYGVYNVDATGQGGTNTGIRAESAAESLIAHLSNSQGLLAIGAQLRWITNNTTDSGVTNLGGPGARDASLYLATV